jgi:hypothetical protein
MMSQRDDFLQAKLSVIVTLNDMGVQLYNNQRFDEAASHFNCAIDRLTEITVEQISPLRQTGEEEADKTTTQNAYALVEVCPRRSRGHGDDRVELWRVGVARPFSFMGMGKILVQRDVCSFLEVATFYVMHNMSLVYLCLGDYRAGQELLTLVLDLMKDTMDDEELDQDKVETLCASAVQQEMSNLIGISANYMLGLAVYQESVEEPVCDMLAIADAMPFLLSGITLLEKEPDSYIGLTLLAGLLTATGYVLMSTELPDAAEQAFNKAAACHSVLYEHTSCEILVFDLLNGHTIPAAAAA